MIGTNNSRFCIIIAQKNVEMAILLANQYAIGEVRLDLCNFDNKSMKKLFSAHSNLIATHRHKEGISYLERQKSLLYAMECGAGWVDIELDFPLELRLELLTVARKKGVKIIVSYHNYICSPSRKEMQIIVNSAKDCKPDVIKLAVLPRSIQEANDILAWYQSEKNLIAFGMGDTYACTRVESFHLGSPFVYVCENEEWKSIAPGLMTSSEFNAMLLV